MLLLLLEVDGRSTMLSLVKLRSFKRRILLPFLIEILIPCCAKHCEMAVESSVLCERVFFFFFPKIVYMGLPVMPGKFFAEYTVNGLDITSSDT